MPSIVATVVLLLDHVPPVDGVFNTVVLKLQKDIIPVIEAGRGFTVTGNIVEQPVEDNVYETVVFPTDKLDTYPELSTVATVGSLVDHVPPVVVSDKDVEEPSQIVLLPVMFAGNGLIEMAIVLKHPPGNV